MVFVSAYFLVSNNGYNFVTVAMHYFITFKLKIIPNLKMVDFSLSSMVEPWQPSFSFLVMVSFTETRAFSFPSF